MNEITIHVRAVNDTKPIFDKIRADSRNFGDAVGIEINKTITERLERETKAQATASSGYARSGDAIGETIGRHISDRINERVRVSVNESLRDHVSVDESGRNRNRETVHVNVDVDVDKQTLGQRIAALGAGIKDKVSGFFGDGIKTGITGVFSGDVISTLIKGGLITLATTVLAPTIGMAISGGVLAALGSGAIGLGLVGAIKDPTVKNALAGLKADLEDAFGGIGKKKKGQADPVGEFGKSFRPAILIFVDSLKGVLIQLKPMIDQIAHDLGPVATNLGQGVIGLLQNLLPAILRGMDAAKPVIDSIADNLPGLGDALARFFDHISSNGPAAAQFFDDLFHVINLIIRALGILVDALSDMYTVTRTVIAGSVRLFLDWAGAVIGAARIAFGWIPGLGPKIDRAAEQFAGFRNKVNKYLSGIKDEDVTIRVKQVFVTVGTIFGDIAAALSKKVTGGAIGAGLVAHAAQGGSRSGLTLVGEHGPELLDAAPGSRVHSNPDTMRMLAGGQGGGGQIVVPVYLDGREIARAMADPMRDLVRNRFGGNVQSAYGYGS